MKFDGLKSIRTLLLVGLDSLLLLVPQPRQKVAVVLRLDAIGDFFIWMQSGAVDVAQAARADSRRSVLIANVAWADYARTTNLWDEVIAFSPVRFMRHPIYRLGMLKKVRRLGAELLIQPRHARVFLQEDAIVRASGAIYRVGSSGTFINLPKWLHSWGNRYYHRLIEVDQSSNTHETVRNNAFVVELLGHPSQKFQFSAAVDQKGNDIVVAIGAGQAGRVWPIEKLAETLLRLKVRRPNERLLLVGSAAEYERANTLERLVGPGRGIVNLIGATNLSEMVQLIASAQLVICNDSSAYHIAMAVGTKVVCFLGGGHFGWYAPYPDPPQPALLARVLYVPMDCYWCNWRCVHPRSDEGTFRCVASIPVEVALNAVENILGSGP